MCIVCELQYYATVCMFCCVKNDIFFANGTKSRLPLHSQTGRDPLENGEKKNFLKKHPQKFGWYYKKVLSLHHFRSVKRALVKRKRSLEQ